MDEERLSQVQAWGDASAAIHRIRENATQAAETILSGGTISQAQREFLGNAAMHEGWETFGVTREQADAATEA